MTTKKLTNRQLAILHFMKQYLVENQRLPTVREIANALGIRSPNGVTYHLRALARHGAIVHLENHRAGSYRLTGVAIRLESTFVVQFDKPSDETLSRRDDATTWCLQEDSPKSLGKSDLPLASASVDACA